MNGQLTKINIENRVMIEDHEKEKSQLKILYEDKIEGLNRELHVLSKGDFSEISEVEQLAEKLRKTSEYLYEKEKENQELL